MIFEMKSLYIYGGSGHAKVVIDAAEKMGGLKIEGVIDDDASLKNKSQFGYPILGGEEFLDSLNPRESALFVAIGSNQVRHRIALKLLNSGFELCTIIHPSAVIGRDVVIGEGTVLMAGTVINSSTEIGRFCILNTGACIDHDCIIGDGAHICPGAKLAGNVHIGEKSWIGINSCVIEGRRIGNDCLVGAGAVVIDDIPDNVRVVGNPAKRHLR